jgi:lipid A 3-O-deacylase
MLRRLGVVGCAAAVLAVSAARGPAHADNVVNAIAIASGALVLTALFSDMPTHDEPDFVSIEGGRFDAVKNDVPSTYFSAEYRSGYFLWIFKPFVGAGANTDGGFWGYGGIRLDTYWGDSRRVVISPSFAIVGYDRGDSKGLGDPLGRAGLDFQYRFDNDIRVGVGFHHMSNGKAFHQKNNPGTELVGLSLAVPVKTLMGLVTE